MKFWLMAAAQLILLLVAITLSLPLVVARELWAVSAGVHAAYRRWLEQDP